MFPYPSEVPHLLGWGVLVLPWNAVIFRVLPQIVAMSQGWTEPHSLSHSVAKCRDRPQD